MSRIDGSAVLEVLLEDGWHHVVEQSFSFEDFEFGLCAPGFSFVETVGTATGRTRRRISGPISSIRAVRESVRLSNRLRRRGAMPRGLFAEVLARDGLVCGICADPVAPNDVHIDHVRPIALGGETVAENLRVTHRGCNLAKGSRFVDLAEATA